MAYFDYEARSSTTTSEADLVDQTFAQWLNSLYFYSFILRDRVYTVRVFFFRIIRWNNFFGFQENFLFFILTYSVKPHFLTLSNCIILSLSDFI